MEGLLSSDRKWNIAVIAFTDIPEGADVRAVNRYIPFIGLLAGLAYIGHTVWVFEGHTSSFLAGIRNADMVIVDSGMIPFLAPNWQTIAMGEALRRPVYIHDRASYSLHLVG